jgi:hypothetical protein
MRRIVAIAAATMVAGACVVFGPAVQASSKSAGTDLAVRGYVAGGERTVEISHPVVFVFTLKNKGPRAITSSADQAYTAVSNGTVVDQLCVFPGGNSFNADSPFCEYGTLPVGQSGQMTLVVQPDPGAHGSELSVRVCSSNESGVPDPVSGNNCVTKRVTLQ